MFEVEINTFDYNKGDYESWYLPFDYHCLYIIEDGKNAYIGETKDVVQRSKEHKCSKDSCSKYNLKNIHVITGKSFEETPAKQFETQLIRLFEADGKFNVINKKEQEWQHYDRKNDFELCFDNLWFELEKKGLVKHKDIQSVMNLTEYKYAMNISLTKSQHDAITSIIHTLDSGETFSHKNGFHSRPILVSGDAGTGKTVVATSLFYYLKQHDDYKNLKIGLVYSTTSTRREIQMLFKSIPGLYKKYVISPIELTKEHYDIIICDEAQRLRRSKNAGRNYNYLLKMGNQRLGLDSKCDELDWILKNSDRQIFFYDEKQSVCPTDITYDSFFARLDSRYRGIRPITLNEQMRVEAGSLYVPYVYDVLNQKTNREKMFDNYEFKLFESFDDMVQQIKNKEKEFGLCRLCGGYAWKWISQDTRDTPDIKIENTSIYWNSINAGWLRDDSKKEEMGSIYSLAGLDLNYTAIVIGNELYYDTNDNCIKVNKDAFYDNKVKNNVSDAELKNFILNTYAVLMTRGIMGTYVYVCDVNLRNYLKKYIPVSE